MKTTIETQTAGQIVISSTFKGDKNWSANTRNQNNHKVKITHNNKSFSFDFWASISEPEITTDEQNVFAFYCALSDAIAAKEPFEDFCSDFGYDTDSRTAERTYKACDKTLRKIERVFSCDHYDLINELQDTYNC